MLKKRTYKYCYMCEAFLASSIKSGARFCRIGQKECQAETIACDKFTTGSFFFCDRRNQWIDFKVCVATRKRKKAEIGTKIHSAENFAKLYAVCANKCKQGIQIEFLFSKESPELEIPEIEIPVQKIKLHRRIKIKRRNAK